MAWADDLPGWRRGAAVGTPATWATRYGNHGSVDELKHPVELLPPGFAAYTVVLHPLSDDGARRPWVTDDATDPWTQITEIATHGLPGDWLAGEIPLSAYPDTGRAIAKVLQVDEHHVDYTVEVFPPGGEAFTVTFEAMRARLRDWTLSGELVMWFPNDLAWVANAPYDMGCTYIASDRATADRILSNPDLEAFECDPPS